jgi:integrase
MRFGNLTGLNLVQHFRREGSGRKQRVFIVIPADEVKNTVDLEFELPPPTIALLDLYLDKHRPRLLKGPEEGWLFPGQKGGHKHEVGLRERLCRVIERVTGLVFNPHLYRHAAAFFYLQEHPGDYETVRLLLGHKSVETTITFYAEFEALTARRIYAEHILERRQRAAVAPERAAW